MSAGFWQALDELVATHRLVIDRPRGSAHPRYPDWTYPADYGYLEGTTSGDGAGIDVWRGSLPDITLTAVVCCVDGAKRDVEIKLLVGCSREEVAMIVALHNDGQQAAVSVERPNPD
jgi:inorganic pyrophosphatase